MDLNELDELFDDHDEEIIQHVNNMRTYTVYERIDHFNTWNENEFRKRFRLTRETVRNIVLPQLEPILAHQHLQYHELKALDQVLLTLRFYATGNFYITMGDFVGIHKTTAGRIIKRVTDAVVSLRANWIKFPDDAYGRTIIQSDFFRLARFPRVIGAVDCTHVKIQSPGRHDAEVFRNRKGFFSLNVQAICDSNNSILDVVARWPGSSHDSHIFRNSSIIRRFQNNEFDDSVLLGDSGYPLMSFLMTPLAAPHTRGEELYNRSHISTRTVIERTFGIWKRRFPILSTGIRCNLQLAQKIIIATAVMHNIAVQARDNAELPPLEHAEELREIDLVENEDVPEFNVVQHRYINYFETL